MLKQAADHLRAELALACFPVADAEFIRRQCGEVGIIITGETTMPFWRLYYHLVWATKNREPLITLEIEPRLYAYIINKAAELGAYTYAINGDPQHTHMVVASPPDVSISKLVQEVKGASSHDINHQDIGFKFAWQRGYGALSLGQKQLDEAIAYVNRQKEHHRNQTTHPWLERYADFDEGPDDHGLGRSRVPALREESVPYHYLGDPPF